MRTLNRIFSSAVGARRCFTTTAPRFAVSPFSLHLKNSYADKAIAAKLKKMKSVKQRGQFLGQTYRALSGDALKLIQWQAKQAPSYKRKSAAKVNKPKRKLTEYNKFVKAHMKHPNLAHLPVTKRMREVARLWRSA